MSDEAEAFREAIIARLPEPEREFARAYADAVSAAWAEYHVRERSLADRIEDRQEMWSGVFDAMLRGAMVNQPEIVIGSRELLHEVNCSRTNPDQTPAIYAGLVTADYVGDPDDVILVRVDAAGPPETVQIQIYRGDR